MYIQPFIRRNSSTILSLVGVVGVVITTVVAVKETPKALQKLEEAKSEKGEELTVTEKVMVAGPTYIPSILIGLGTIACIVSSNVLSRHQQAALTSAYALIDNSYKEYKRKLIELYGEETHQNIIDSIAIEKAKEVGVNAGNFVTNCQLSREASCGDPVLFYDEYSDRYFESTIEQVIIAEYHLNRNLVLRGFVVLNELYDFLGLEPTDYGSEVGWTVEDELYWIDFDHRKVWLDDEVEYYIIETPWGPSTSLQEYYFS